MAKDFTKFLDAPIESHEAPKTPPIGHYFATIGKPKVQERDFGPEHGKRVLATLPFRLDSQDDDSRSEEELTEKELRAAMVSKDYALNGDRPQGHMIRTLAEKTLGLNTTGLSFGEVLESLEGQQVKIYGEHRADKNDPDVFYFEVKKVLSAND